MPREQLLGFVTAVTAKALAQTYYAAPPRHAYFDGCSTGGRQGLISAQRFPDDFDGIIGSDFIKQYVVEVDYQNRLLKLHDKDKFAYSGAGESIPIQLNQMGYPLLDGEVTPTNGESIKGKFVLDLGSSGALVLMSPVVTQHNLLGNGMKTIKALGVGGAGGQSNGQIGRVRSLQIGNF